MKRIVVVASAALMLFATTSCGDTGPTSVNIVGPTYVVEGQAVVLEARANRAKYDNDFVWSVDNKNIATIDVNTGLFTAKNKGTVKVTATCKYNKNVKNDTQISVFEWNPIEETEFLTIYEKSYKALANDIKTIESGGQKKIIKNAENGCSFMGSPVNKGLSFMLTESTSGIFIHSVSQDDVIMETKDNLKTIIDACPSSKYGDINFDSNETLYFYVINPESQTGTVPKSFLIFKNDGTIKSYYVENETYLVFE